MYLGLTVPLVLVFLCLGYSGGFSKDANSFKDANFFNEYFYILSVSSANESFGVSMAPIETNGAVSLIVGAPRSSNNLPREDSLGGFFQCNLKKLSCSDNQASHLNMGSWNLSNLGFSVAVAGTDTASGSGNVVAICDPRARLHDPKRGGGINYVQSVGLCYLVKPGPDLSLSGYGAASYSPKLLHPSVSNSLTNMMFGSSVAALPDASGSPAFAYGFPYLLLAFGGTVFTSVFKPAELTMGPHTFDKPHPVVFWGHSYLGGFSAEYAAIDSPPADPSHRGKDHVTDVSKELHKFYERLADYRIGSFSCAGYAIATSSGVLGNRQPSEYFDLAEGAPCPPIPELQRHLFPESFRQAYSRMFAAAWLAGEVRLYRVARDTSKTVCSGRGSEATFEERSRSTSCFADSSLRATLRPPGGRVGDRFGHAVLLLDVNADGWDDVIVAAPGSGDAMSSAIGGYWVLGAVYVYINAGGTSFIASDSKPSYELRFPSCSAVMSAVCRQASSSSAGPPPPLCQLCESAKRTELRFGWSLAGLGDIDQDGCQDFAVGAPLTGNARAGFGGAAAIYLGARSGAPRLAQVVARPGVRGFGESLSPGADFDASGRPDLAVAAPLEGSGRVYFYPSRYVLSFDVNVVSSNPSRLDQQLGGSSFNIELQLNLSRILHGPALKSGEALSYSVQLQLFIDRSPFRWGPVRFKPLNLGPNNTLLIDANFRTLTPIHLRYDASLMGPHADRSSPLVVQAIWVATRANPGAPGLSPHATGSGPLLRSPHVRGARHSEGDIFPLITIPWNHGCSDHLCVTRLSLTCQSNAKRNNASGKLELLITAAPSLLEIECQVSAAQEPAFTSYLVLDYPDGLMALEKADVLLPGSLAPENVVQGSSGSSIFLGNPIPVSGRAKVRLLFKPLAIRPDVGSLDFNFTVTTSSKTPSGAPSWQQSIRPKTELAISMQAQFDKSLSYGSLSHETPHGFNAFQGSLYKLTSPRNLPRLQVTLANRASAHLPTSYLLVHWPIETTPLPGETNGKYLMYLQTAPFVTHGVGTGGRHRTSVTCNSAQLAAISNPLRLKPDSLDGFAPPDTATSASSPVNVSDGVRLSLNRPLPPPLTLPANRTNPRASCSRADRFDFAYSCGSKTARCLPLLCRLGELSSRTEPLQLTFVAVAYHFTFFEENKLCASVNIMPSVQWLPGPEYEDSAVLKDTGEPASALPVLQSVNVKTPEPEELSLLSRILLYVGSPLLGATILGLFILILAQCTPFFQRRRHQLQLQQQQQHQQQHHQQHLLQHNQPPSAGTALVASPLESRYRYDEDDADYYN